MPFRALIFDVDGVIAETEANGHRVAFNRVFQEEGIHAHWDMDTYGTLLAIAGGKERMKTVITAENFRRDVGDNEEYIKKLHRRKTEVFQQLVSEGQILARRGVKRLVHQAHSRGVKLGIATTSNITAATFLIRHTLGEEIFNCFDVVLAGDMVKKKKPDPEIYNLAAERLGVANEECAVVEDMVIGLKAAKDAGMKCIITKSYYSRNDDFTGADLVVEDLGEPGDKFVVTIETISNLFPC